MAYYFAGTFFMCLNVADIKLRIFFKGKKERNRTKGILKAEPRNLLRHMFWMKEILLLYIDELNAGCKENEGNWSEFEKDLSQRAFWLSKKLHLIIFP